MGCKVLLLLETPKLPFFLVHHFYGIHSEFFSAYPPTVRMIILFIFYAHALHEFGSGHFFPQQFLGDGSR